MASAAVTHVFVNGTAADAIQMNTNFDDLVDFINDETIHADGSKPFTDNVSQPTTPTDADHLTRKGYVDDQTALVIPKSIVDAAGDLIVADAADSVIRLPKGANGTALGVAGGTVGWQSAAAIPPRLVLTSNGHMVAAHSNTWIPAGGSFPSTPPTPANVLNILEYVGPFMVGSAIDIDFLGYYANAIGSGFNARMGLYTASLTTGKPETLVVETASDAAAAGVEALSITTTTLQPGTLYYLAIVVSASQGSFYHYDAASQLGVFGAGNSTPVYTENMKWTEAHAYGALPATATPVAVAETTAPSGTPVLWVQVV